MIVRLYIEGGGDGQLLDTLFRKGWANFFERAGLGGKMPRVVRGKGRKEAFEKFSTAVRQADPGVLPLLLVDSEDPVDARHSVWEHLKARDNWDKPSGADDGHGFLMVQVMETWLLADRDLLRNYFGSSFREHHLPNWPDLELIAKNDVYLALERATSGCNRKYRKGRVSFELLGQLNPDLVEKHCSQAKSLLDRIRNP